MYFVWSLTISRYSSKRRRWCQIEGLKVVPSCFLERDITEFSDTMFHAISFPVCLERHVSKARARGIWRRSSLI